MFQGVTKFTMDEETDCSSAHSSQWSDRWRPVTSVVYASESLRTSKFTQARQLTSTSCWTAKSGSNVSRMRARRDVRDVRI